MQPHWQCIGVVMQGGAIEIDMTPHRARPERMEPHDVIDGTVRCPRELQDVQKFFRSIVAEIIWIHADMLIPFAIRCVSAVAYKQRSSMEN